MAVQRGTEREPFMEGSTLRLTATLVDEDGAAIDAAAVTDLRVTLRTYPGAAVINSRANQAAKTTNGGSMTGNVWKLRLNGDDCAAQAGETDGLVQRELLVTVTYNLTGGGSGTLNFQRTYYVRLLGGFPQA